MSITFWNSGRMSSASLLACVRPFPLCLPFVSQLSIYLFTLHACLYIFSCSLTLLPFRQPAYVSVPATCFSVSRFLHILLCWCFLHFVSIGFPICRFLDGLPICSSACQFARVLAWPAAFVPPPTRRFQCLLLLSE